MVKQITKAITKYSIGFTVLLLSVSLNYVESAQNWATSMAPSDASISSYIEQLTGHAGHDIKCHIVCGVAPHLHSRAEAIDKSPLVQIFFASVNLGPESGRSQVGRPPKRWAVKVAGNRWMREAWNRSLWRHLGEVYVQQWTFLVSVDIMIWLILPYDTGQIKLYK